MEGTINELILFLHNRIDNACTYQEIEDMENALDLAINQKEFKWRYDHGYGYYINISKNSLNINIRYSIDEGEKEVNITKKFFNQIANTLYRKLSIHRWCVIS